MGLWKKCLDTLEAELSSQQFNTWIRPLHVIEEEASLRLCAPNRFVLDWVTEHFLIHINELVTHFRNGEAYEIVLEIGGETHRASIVPSVAEVKPDSKPADQRRAAPERAAGGVNLQPKAEYTFENFIGGKSNQLARAAAFQVAENSGGAYNPLLIYGGVGLGKTHLMNAIGNRIREQDSAKKVVYLNGERFVSEMVIALQHKNIDKFKQFYRSVDGLLIDDIQFLANKELSQDIFFHTFNALLDQRHQIVLTCDRFPKEVKGLEERLSSRFSWGLSVVVETPELETRVAILRSKAEAAGVTLPMDVTFFIARRFRSNVRELEGALRRVIANSHFTGNPVTLDFTKEALKDLLALQDKQVTIENIQKTVAEYYKIRVVELLSAKRTRALARPRQIAMALAKELTNYSLPEIGTAFGGRDHTTVLHACRKVADLKESDERLGEEYSILVRTLTG